MEGPLQKMAIKMALESLRSDDPEKLAEQVVAGLASKATDDDRMRVLALAEAVARRLRAVI